MLLESEYAGSVQLAAGFTEIGCPTTVEEALERFVGLSGRNFVAALEAHFGGPLPEAFYVARKAEDARVLADGLDAVAGAIDFVRALPGLSDTRVLPVSSSGPGGTSDSLVPPAGVTCPSLRAVPFDVVESELEHARLAQQINAIHKPFRHPWHMLGPQI